jgi:hypothetical protein
LYEYISTGNKILCIDPVNSEGGKLVNSIKYSMLLNPFEDLSKLDIFLSNAFKDWEEQNYNTFNIKDFLKYERNEQTKKLIKCIEGL